MDVAIAANAGAGFVVGLALDAAREQHLELLVTQALVPHWQEAIADRHGDEDVSAVIAVASSRTTGVPA